MLVTWTLMAGATYQTPANAWVGGSFFCASPAQSNFLNTTGNLFELFDVSLTEGSVAPPFQVPDYASELALCKRYYTITNHSLRAWATAGSQNFAGHTLWPVEMRGTPTTLVGTPGAYTNMTGPTLSSQNSKGAIFSIVSNAGGDTYALVAPIWLNARL
jgi:hypothetical protein